MEILWHTSFRQHKKTVKLDSLHLREIFLSALLPSPLALFPFSLSVLVVTQRQPRNCLENINLPFRISSVTGTSSDGRSMVVRIRIFSRFLSYSTGLLPT